jgi:DNA-binding NtrC family response regulator
LLEHPWPSNVRELENAIERAAVLTRDEVIGPKDLLLDRPAARASATARGTLQKSIDELVRARIDAALEASDGNRAEAARQLGIDRATLWRPLKRRDM